MVTKAEKKKITIYETIKLNNLLSDYLDNVIRTLTYWKDEYNSKNYENLQMRVDIDYTHEYYDEVYPYIEINVSRLETDEEQEERVSQLLELEKERRKQNKLKREQKKQKEYEEYKRSF